MKGKNCPVSVYLCGSCLKVEELWSLALHLAEWRLRGHNLACSVEAVLSSRSTVSSLQGWVLCLPQLGQESHAELYSLL